MDKKPKLLFVGATPPPFHGVLVQNERILNSRLKDEFEIIHLDTSDHRDLNNLGKVDFGNLYGGIIQLLKLVYLKFRYRPDVVYMTLAQNRVAFLRDGLFIIIAKLLSKTKSVVHFRGGNFLNYYKNESNIIKHFIDYVYSKIDYGIILGNNLKSMVSRWFEDDRIFIIPNGTSFAMDSDRTKTEINRIYIGYIGLLSPSKGTENILKAFIYLSKKYNNLFLVLAGDFAYDESEFKQSFMRLIKDCSAMDRIILKGVVKGAEKEEFFVNLDVFIFPSLMEGHPNAVLEAMVAGCPVVATDVGAVSESVIDGINGFLIKPNDIDALVQKIELLIQNQELRNQMGKKSRELYEKYFTSEKNIDRLIEAFKSVI